MTGMSDTVPNYVPVAEGSMDYIKQLVAQCADAGIDVSLDQCRKKS